MSLYYPRLSGSMSGPSSQPHTSLYPWSWLRYNSYDPPMSQPPKPECVPAFFFLDLQHIDKRTRRILWGSKILQDPPTVTYEEAMAPDGQGLFKWLSRVDKFGFCFVSGVPATPEATEELSRRIGFIRETQCQSLPQIAPTSTLTDLCVDGTFWDFTSNLAKGDTAYTTLALGAHTDTTYFVSIPSLAPLLHSQLPRPILVDCSYSISLSTPVARAAQRCL